MLIGFHLRHCFSPLEPITDILLNEVVEYKRIGTLAPVFGYNADEQHIDRICMMPFDGIEHTYPSKRKQAAVFQFALCLGERRESDAETHHFVVLAGINDDAHQVQVGNADILVDELVHLSLTQRGKPIEVAITDIEHLENLASIAFFHQFLSGEFVYLEIITPAYHLCNLAELLRYGLGHLHLALHPVVVFLESTYLLHMTRIVGKVIVGIGCGILAESFDKHTFTVGVGKSHRSYHRIHATLPSPLFNF